MSPWLHQEVLVAPFTVAPPRLFIAAFASRVDASIPTVLPLRCPRSAKRFSTKL
jgi:hypothetical protein